MVFVSVEVATDAEFVIGAIGALAGTPLKRFQMPPPKKRMAAAITASPVAIHCDGPNVFMIVF